MATILIVPYNENGCHGNHLHHLMDHFSQLTKFKNCKWHVTFVVCNIFNSKSVFLPNEGPCQTKKPRAVPEWLGQHGQTPIQDWGLRILVNGFRIWIKGFRKDFQTGSNLPVNDQASAECLQPAWWASHKAGVNEDSQLPHWCYSTQLRKHPGIITLSCKQLYCLLQWTKPQQL